MIGLARNRKPFRRRGIWCVLLILIGCAGCLPKPGFRTVVLITIDTLRADHVGAYGYPRPTTPFLDHLAAEGVVFENAYSSSSHTAPSHASLFTSLYPEAHGVLRNGARLPPGQFTTLADALSLEGFETAAFTSVSFLDEIAGGFDYLDHGKFQLGERAFRSSGETVSAALEWLLDREPGTDLFLWIHLYDVHAHSKREGPHEKFLPRLREYMATDSSDFEEYLERVYLGDPLSKRQKRHLLQYDARLAYVDSEIDRLFQAVEEDNAGSTLWIVTSDHGEGLGNHGIMGHGPHLYTEQLRVPLIVYAEPPVWPHARVSHLVRLVDLYPTILDLVNAPSVGGPIEGVSLYSLLASPQATVEIEYVYAQRRPMDEKRAAKGWEPGLVLAVQNLREKYIYHESEPDEYFDLSTDPAELRNLAYQQSHEAERLKRWLLDRYSRFRQQRPALSGEIQPEHLEELRALGYLN